MRKERAQLLSAAAAIALAACGAVESAVAAEAAAVAALGESVRTQHAITVDGQKLAYTATAGTVRVRLDKSNAQADIFFVSYDKAGEDRHKRPITFVFNGGPGSSAAWLHVGGLGPRRLALEDDGDVPEPPVRLVDNAETWLRFTDLVFVDPVGTGFSRAIATGEASADSDGRPFWSIRSDLRSLAEFIRLYLTRNDRWASPKYLAGESYGGFRAAALVEALPAQGGIELSGAVLISPVIEYTLNLGNDYLNVMPWATFVPSYAATAFHYGKYRGAGKTLEQVCAEAEAFSRSELLVALASGARKSPEVSRAFTRLAEMTGLNAAEVQRHRGRVTAEIFATRLLEESGQVLGIYDGSVSAPDPEPFKSIYPQRDPSLDPLIAPVVSSFNAYVRDELGYLTDVRYELMNPEVSRAWNWTEAGLGDLPGVGPRLRSALSLNPHLKVLITHGYFDLATPYFASKYVVERLELDETVSRNLSLAVYPGGHMFYLRQDARIQSYRDAKALYEAAAVAPAR